MIRSKNIKEEDLTKENLIGKAIVDPSGNIIAKCVDLIEDEKKKLYLKMAVKTEFDSDFIIEETIPVSAIASIGEIILLKKQFEIKPIEKESLIIVEFPDLEEKESKTIEEKPIENLENENKEKKSNNPDKVKNITSQAKTKKASKHTNKPKKHDNELIKDQSELNQPLLSDLDNKFNLFLTEKNIEQKGQLLKDFIVWVEGQKDSNKILLELLNKMSTSEYIIRKNVVEIISHIANTKPGYLIPVFIKGLDTIYNEPSKEIEERIIQYLSKVASDKSFEMLHNELNNYFEDLIINQVNCKNISRNRIHNINLRIFVNNFDVQEKLVHFYLKEILTKNADAKEFSEFLSDYNALIIAYSLIQSFDQNEWNQILNSKLLQNLEPSFKDSIVNFLDYFKSGNIKLLAETVEPKLGYQYSNKIISIMLKTKLRDVLANVSIIPLEVLSSYFQDDKNRSISLIFDLITKKEINAQVVFIDNKTYISPTDNW
ncbi:MAG: hypothetical protein FK734_10855 [Asgard group archaeon]|nr:hypothetical protein [Asgard group archaeon]